MSPVGYDLCQQTVTVYRLQEGFVKRNVLDRVFYDYGVTQVTDQQGRHQVTQCLLIIPGASDIQPGDRVYDGIGPDINEKEWKHFLPVTVKGLSEIGYVAPYFWKGHLCHTEAGRR